MIVFLISFLSIWGVMHAYVFWRLASVPAVVHFIPPVALGIIAAALWLSYAVARILDSKGLQRIIWPLEYLAANWIGVLFLLFCSFLVADIATIVVSLFGHALPLAHS